jgi:hypothetical protein
MFPDWTEYGDEWFLWRGPPTYEPLWVYRPRTWLLREGWKKHGATISCREVPSMKQGWQGRMSDEMVPERIRGKAEHACSGSVV